jgi:hypothetical protein
MEREGEGEGEGETISNKSYLFFHFKGKLQSIVVKSKEYAFQLYSGHLLQWLRAICLELENRELIFQLQAGR